MLEQKDIEVLTNLFKTELEATRKQIREDIVESEKMLLNEIDRMHGITDKKRKRLHIT